MKQNRPQREPGVKVLKIGDLAWTTEEWHMGTYSGHPAQVRKATTCGQDSETITPRPG